MKYFSRVRAQRTEDGSTLVESILAVAILGIVGVAALASVVTLISSGDRSRRAERATVAAQSAADAIASTSATFVPCSPESTYQAAINALGTSAIPADITVIVSSVNYFDGSGFQPTCPTTAEGDSRRVQQIVVIAIDARATRRVTFVKREP